MKKSDLNLPHFYAVYATDIGHVTVLYNDKTIFALSSGTCSYPNATCEKRLIANQLIGELEEYLGGKRRSFSICLSPKGTPFQMKVWHALLQIPYGQTRSYKQIAQTIGNEKASRAVGSANRNNPLLILIPCHRVIHQDGSLSGYAAGVELKEKLLNLEQKHLNLK